MFLFYSESRGQITVTQTPSVETVLPGQMVSLFIEEVLLFLGLHLDSVAVDPG